MNRFACSVSLGCIAALTGTGFGQIAAGGGEGNDLESVAISPMMTGEFGARVLVRGFDNGRVEHNFYSSSAGYSGWEEIPDPIDGWFPDELESVAVTCFDTPPGARLYTRMFECGLVQQNIYTTALGYTGWLDLPHDDDLDCEDSAKSGGIGVDWESTDVVALNGLYGPRLFVRAQEPGLIEQCVYTPGDGYMGWTEVPSLGDIPVGDGFVVGNQEDVEAVAVTAFGGLYDLRVFVVGLDDGTRSYQNIYTPKDGYLGWTDLPDPDRAIAVGSQIESMDVLRLDNPPGSLLYLRGLRNGRVHQNIYTPATGFTGFERVPGGLANPNGLTLDSCAVAAFDGLFGPRVYIRGFACGLVEQNVYTPENGYTGWTEVPPGDGDECDEP